MFALVFKGNEILFAPAEMKELDVLVYKTLELFTQNYSKDRFIEIRNRKSKTCLLRDGIYLICFSGGRDQLAAIYTRFKFYFKSFEDASLLQVQEYFNAVTGEIPTRGIRQIANPSLNPTILASQRLQTLIPFNCELILLYKKELVYTTMKSFDDLKVVYDYLTDPTIGLFDDSLVNQIKPKGEALISTTEVKKSFFSRKEKPLFSGYLIGGMVNDTLVTPKHVYLSEVKKGLVVYQFQEALTFVILSSTTSDHFLQLSWYKSLMSQLDSIALDLKPHLKRDVIRSKYAFMIYNEIDFVIKEVNNP